MKFTINSYRQIQFIGTTFLLVLIVFTLYSCERDEGLLVKPIDIDNSCDTNNVSFNEFILPVIDKNCIVCHNNSNQYAGINLEGYEKIKKYAENDLLMGSLISSMRNYLWNDCDFAKIQAWINQGTKNN